MAVNPAQVYAVQPGSAATATGDKFLQAPDSGLFVGTLKDAIVAAGTAQRVAVTGPGHRGPPAHLSAVASTDQGEPIVLHDWDFTCDGTDNQRPHRHARLRRAWHLARGGAGAGQERAVRHGDGVLRGGPGPGYAAQRPTGR
ncbi:hypothetical protein Acsp05_72110 [Actinokineospora sp. NBRC 105648]|nr:hypothetical protein Acsp05_72110 [Actinokineospora sp. NBRC 105648]